MDPFKEGKKIFKKIHQEIGKNAITNTKDFEKFLKLLYKETKGNVIFDFLDATNWDLFEDFKIDIKNQIVSIIWHNFSKRKEPKEIKEMRKWMFPADVYALNIHFQEMKLLDIGYTSIFLIRGYSKTINEIKKIMQQGADKLMINSIDNNFSVKVIKKSGELYYDYDFFNTPIYSIAILPKNIGIPSGFSKGILFCNNLSDCQTRTQIVINDLSTDSENIDFICEKSNTLRRIMENILKIECCYRYRQINVKKSYSELLLGDLVRLTKGFKDANSNKQLNKIVRLSNKLSHDSGHVVEKLEAIELSSLVKDYCDSLFTEVYSTSFPQINN